MIENAGNEPAYEVPEAFMQALRELAAAAGKERVVSGQAYDAIVVGARCAGSPTAMLLARSGHRVLLLDRAEFPSDTISTHLDPSARGRGTRALGPARPRPRDRHARRSTPTRSISGRSRISGAPGTDEAPCAYAPRRTVLDKLLVDAAADAGAEVRERFVVESLVMDGDRVAGIRGHGKGGKTVTEQAAVVIGADGRNSLVADAVGAEEYHEKPRAAGELLHVLERPADGRPLRDLRPSRAGVRGVAHARRPDARHRRPPDRRVRRRQAGRRRQLPRGARDRSRVRRARARLRSARSASSAPRSASCFRKPYGPGWALVGDAGYNKDFITAQGIHDAFRDAESCAAALDAWFAGGGSFEDAMREYQARRDEQVLPMYEFTADLAMLAPLSPELQQVMSAVSGSQDAMDGFARVIGGVTSPAEFFSDENVGRILGVAS